MAGKLEGQKVAFLATDGVELIELTEPWEAVKKEGGQPVLVSTKGGEIQGFNHDDKGDMLPVDAVVKDADPSEFDALMLPGGTKNPDRLRVDENAVEFVRQFFDNGKPVAAICHGPWMLVEADVVKGRTLTSWPSLKTDIRNAVGTWVDEEVHVDGAVVTSRKPADLPAFDEKLVEVFAQHAKGEQRAAS
jgi:protease I